MSCPGNDKRCNGNGQCDLTTGLCACDEEHQGLDCSKLTCPGDCSNAGVCDTSTGQCSCDPGRHGLDCSSMLTKIYIPKILAKIFVVGCHSWCASVLHVWYSSNGM